MCLSVLWVQTTVSRCVWSNQAASPVPVTLATASNQMAGPVQVYCRLCRGVAIHTNIHGTRNVVICFHCFVIRIFSVWEAVAKNIYWCVKCIHFPWLVTLCFIAQTPVWVFHSLQLHARDVNLHDCACMSCASAWWIVGIYIFVICMFFLADIDECAVGTHQCGQNCHNNVGSYTCSCNTGYRLAPDGRSCLSECLCWTGC